MYIFSRIQIVERTRPEYATAARIRLTEDSRAPVVVEYAVRRRYWLPFIADEFMDLTMASVRWRPEHDSDVWSSSIAKAAYHLGRAKNKHARVLSGAEVKAMVELEK